MPRSYLEDASGFLGRAEKLCAPATAAEVSEVLRQASESGTPVTVAGAGTGLTGGRCARGGWVVSLEKFRQLEVGSGTARAGAAVTLQDLQAGALATRQFFPPDPTEWTASLGGAIATNASGSRSFRYGATRNWVNALTVAFIDGRVREFRRGDKVDFEYTAIRPPQAVKHTAGYYLREDLDWVDLLCGSEGTLGVVLGAEVMLLTQPAELLTGVVFFGDESAALRVIPEWKSIKQLRMLELFDGNSLLFLRQKYPTIPVGAGAALLVEQELDGLDGDPLDEWANRLIAAEGMDDSWFGETPSDRERFRAFRHALPEMVNERVKRNGFMKMGSDYAVPPERNSEILGFYRARLEKEFPDKSVVFGHIGEAHVHVNLLPQSAEDVERGKALMLEFARKVVELGGTVSAEHGLGKRKAHLLEIEYTREEIEAMKSVKRRLDPEWLLGQGTLFENT